MKDTTPWQRACPPWCTVRHPAGSLPVHRRVIAETTRPDGSLVQIALNQRSCAMPRILVTTSGSQRTAVSLPAEVAARIADWIAVHGLPAGPRGWYRRSLTTAAELLTA